MKFVEEPPPPGSGRKGQPVAYLKEAEALRQNPNRWALIQTTKEQQTARNVAHKIKHADYVAFREGTWEAVSRTVDGEHRVYARYVA